MNRTFDLVLGSAGLIIALVLVGWGFFTMIRKSYDPVKMFGKVAFTIPFVMGCIWFGVKLGPFGPFLIVFMAVILSLMWTPHITELIVSPFTNLLDGGSERPDDKPFYSIANAKRNKGAYPAAIAEVRKQMERFPADFEGIMLIASIQAENQNDLAAAENTLNKFCAPVKAPEKQVAAAWTTLADWYLKVGMDVDSARASLEKIIARYPGTELALKAEQRLAHLDDVEKHLLAKHDRQRIAVPQGVHNVGLRDSSELLKPKEIEPGKLAAAYVQQLESHPHDSETREKLATIYARDFQRLDLATMELSQLIDEPRHSPKQITNWLNMLANYQFELGADQATVRATLEQIIERFPDLPLAETTRRRLERLNGDFKGKEKTPGVALGVYEQNIGLKYGGPKKPS